MKQIIGGILGFLIGIGLMFGINLLPEPFADKDMITLGDTYIPSLKMVSEDVRLESNELTEKEILLKYDGASIKKETILEYCDLLERYGYRNLKNDLSEEENGEFINIFLVGQDKLLYVTCIKNPDVVSIEYSLEEGNIEIFDEEKYFVYDARNQYYDMKVDEKIIKIPALDNVVELDRDTRLELDFNNYLSRRYIYPEHTTSEQKDAYLNKYGELLIENGFLQGDNKREFYNNIVKVSIDNDFRFEVSVKKNY